jgi:mitochondrial fission protein ELM1
MKLNILLITDNKPGHENISKGIIAEIQKYQNVNILIQYAKLRSSIFKKPLTWILNRTSFWKKNRWLINLSYKNVNFEKLNSIDIIISTGGATSFLNVMLSHITNAPNIYCSSLRGLDNKLFSHIISLQKLGYDNEIVLDLAPIESFDINKANMQKDTWALLIGGPTKDYPFTDDEMFTLVSNLIQLAKDKNSKLYITTSRRTSILLENRLKQFTNNKYIKELVLFNHTSKKIARVFLENAEMIFCTQDSGSMITEAVLCKKPVYTIYTNRANPKGINKKFIENLINKNYIISINIEDIKNINLNNDFNFIQESPSKIVYNTIKDSRKNL